jgi:hypothetical protein
MLLRKDIRWIGQVQPYYSLSLTQYVGSIKRQHMCYVLTTLSVSLVGLSLIDKELHK